ncbi:MAG: hypothetical protein CMD74_00415 [Gammaproteobacteria bacterium]|nr:hypothetical protein [Gammaproteobacteria bacterium]
MGSRLRQAAYIFAVFSLALRLAVPAGFMPSELEENGFYLKPCPGHSTLGLKPQTGKIADQISNPASLYQNCELGIGFSAVVDAESPFLKSFGAATSVNAANHYDQRFSPKILPLQNFARAPPIPIN